VLQGFRDFQQGGRGKIFAASASVTPAIFSGTAQVGLQVWNGSAVAGGKGVTAFLLGASFGLTTGAITTAVAIGVTGAGGQPAAPTATGAVGTSGDLLIGSGTASQCNVYASGTYVNGGGVFLVLGRVHIGLTSVDTDDDNFVHLGGLIEVPLSSWAGVATSATVASGVLDISIVWAEVPN